MDSQQTGHSGFSEPSAAHVEAAKKEDFEAAQDAATVGIVPATDVVMAEAILKGGQADTAAAGEISDEQSQLAIGDTLGGSALKAPALPVPESALASTAAGLVAGPFSLSSPTAAPTTSCPDLPPTTDPAVPTPVSASNTSIAHAAVTTTTTMAVTTAMDSVADEPKMALLDPELIDMFNAEAGFTPTPLPERKADTPEPESDTEEPCAINVDQPMSKKRAKRMAKWAAKAERRKARRAEEKEKKRVKAEQRKAEVQKKFAAMDPEAQEQWKEERRLRYQKRQEEEKLARERCEKALKEGQRIIIDMSFEKKMQDREIRSLCKQVQYSYAHSIQAAHPAHIMVASCSGRTRDIMKKQCQGVDRWHMTVSDQPYTEMFKGKEDELVYLTADSLNVIDTLDPSKAYIVGGLVDRNRCKGICYEKATNEGIATARLPLAQHLALMGSPILTVNHVVALLIDFQEKGDWGAALRAIVPSRKHKQRGQRDPPPTRYPPPPPRAPAPNPTEDTAPTDALPTGGDKLLDPEAVPGDATGAPSSNPAVAPGGVSDMDVIPSADRAVESGAEGGKRPQAEAESPPAGETSGDVLEPPTKKTRVETGPGTVGSPHFEARTWDATAAVCCAMAD